MSAPIARSSISTESDRPAMSLALRWLLGLFFVGLTVVLLAVFAAAMFAFWWWTQERAAGAAVADEVARLRQAGAPMTADDLYRFHAIPPTMPDTTPAWLAAQKSAASGTLIRDGKSLPYLGEGQPARLRPDAADSQLAAALKLLADHDATLQAILSAARQPGEARYPVKFEQGPNAAINSVANVRAVVRLLALHARVMAIRRENDAAIDSIGAMFAASETISHQLTIVEQLVRLATLGAALEQCALLIHEASLDHDQLVRVAGMLAACDIQGDFARGLIGERAMGYQGLVGLNTVAIATDSRKYLEVMDQTIQFSAQPLPAGRKRLQTMIAQFKAEEAAGSIWTKSTHPLTAQVLPSISSSFDALAKIVAYREALLTAVAAERYRLKTGRLPTRLAELVPDFLPAWPVDPFDGQPLRLRVDGDDILIYSVGVNEKDDGAVNSPGNSGEPDIVVRVAHDKAGAR